MSKKSINKMFDGKSFEDLAKDIYDNQKLKKTQIDLLIQELHSFIQTAEDALMIAPIIKEYFDVSVKNDEHLVKLASVVQRYISKSNESKSNENEFGLSDNEKAELMSTLQTTVSDLQKESDRLDNMKDKKVIGD